MADELRHHGGISPAWLTSHDDLELFDTQADHRYLVHGGSVADRLR